MRELEARSQAECLHPILVIAGAAREAFGRHRFDCGEITWAEGELGSGAVIAESLKIACAGNGDEVLALCEHLTEGELSGSTAVLFRECGDFVDDV